MSPTTPVQHSCESGPGFAPDSIYASWSAEERAADDRQEKVASDRQARVLATRDMGAIAGLCDDGLRSLAKRHRRRIEDDADGSCPMASGQRRVVAGHLRAVETEQEWRNALNEAYGATFDGTHVPGSFSARGGVEAVREHGATPPSYYLAALLDRREHYHGRESVFDWGETESAVAA